MRRSISFTCPQISKLGWCWTQRCIDRRSWSCECIHERMSWWTAWEWVVGCKSTNYRLGDRLKAECLFGSQHGWGDDCRGPGCCSYLEHTASTDCAFLSFSRPVFRLFFGHRISFQPLGSASNLKSLISGNE